MTSVSAPRRSSRPRFYRRCKNCGIGSRTVVLLCVDCWRMTFITLASTALVACATWLWGQIDFRGIAMLAKELL